MSVQLIYDGSFEGLLSAIFEYYDLGLRSATVRPRGNNTGLLFGEEILVTTDQKKAERVWQGLKRKAGSAGARSVFKSYLSELPGIDDQILEYVKLVFSTSGNAAQDYSNPLVLKIANTVKKVDREKHRMDAFVRFRLTKDNIYVAAIEPDFNVLPLNAKHFKQRYADQPWMIFDLKRHYGIFYDLSVVRTIALQDWGKVKNGLADELLAPSEIAFTDLWKQYFKSSNIKARRNSTLHLRHVPRRYWKYLGEKQP